MSRKAWKAIAALGVLDIVCFALTIHAHLSFHRAPGGPSSMSLGQVVGWVASIVLLVLIALVVCESRLSAGHRPRRPRRK